MDTRVRRVWQCVIDGQECPSYYDELSNFSTCGSFSTLP